MLSEELKKKWNAKVDKATIEDVKKLDANGGKTGDYEEVPTGKYEVDIENMEIAEAKTSGKPMLKIQCRIRSGNYKGRCIFINQIITESFQFHSANELLRGILNDTDIDDIDVEWTGDYGAYEKLVSNILDSIEGQYNYDIEYSKNKKGFGSYEFVATYANE